MTEINQLGRALDGPRKEQPEWGTYARPLNPRPHAMVSLGQSWNVTGPNGAGIISLVRVTVEYNQDMFPESKVSELEAQTTDMTYNIHRLLTE